MNDSRELYLKLLKRVLTHTLWPDLIIPIKRKRIKNIKNFIKNLVLDLFKYFEIYLSKKSIINPDSILEGKLWPYYAETMIGIRRLDNIQYCLENVIKNKIKGDLIEAGVWRGGATIFMKAILKVYNEEDRKIYVADSFCGLPKPDEKKYPLDKADKHWQFDELKISLEEVKNNFIKYDLLDDKIIFLKGWFKDTLPKAPIEDLALLRLDGDIYESTIDSLSSLYPKLSVGGYVIVDDYLNNFSCRQAVDDYRAANGINEKINKIDWTGVYWCKEAGS
jgi:hypothetical protein